MQNQVDGAVLVITLDDKFHAELRVWIIVIRLTEMSTLGYIQNVTASERVISRKIRVGNDLALNYEVFLGQRMSFTFRLVNKGVKSLLRVGVNALSHKEIVGIFTAL